MSSMKYQIERFPNGTASIRNLELNECMHSSIGAWTEAQLIYVAQSQIVETLTSMHPSHCSGPLVIYDIGLGIGANALATLEAVVSLPVRPDNESKAPRVHLISFETQLEGIRAALQYPSDFPFLEKYQEPLQQLLNEGHWKYSGQNLRPRGIELHWELKLGDFRDHMISCPKPDVIFFDLHSPKTCPALWGFQTFQLLFSLQGAKETRLITYSASTAVRSALLLAGFYVGKGVSTSLKKETTLAASQRNLLKSPLDLHWLEHWRRSSRAIPQDYPDQDLVTAYEKIKAAILE